MERERNNYFLLEIHFHSYRSSGAHLREEKKRREPQIMIENERISQK